MHVFRRDYTYGLQSMSYNWVIKIKFTQGVLTSTTLRVHGMLQKNWIFEESRLDEKVRMVAYHGSINVTWICESLIKIYFT